MIAHVYMLLLEAAVLAASFGMLWLSFRMRDRHRRYREMRPGEQNLRLFDLTSEQQDGAYFGASNQVTPVKIPLATAFVLFVLARNVLQGCFTDLLLAPSGGISAADACLRARGRRLPPV